MKDPYEFKHSKKFGIKVTVGEAMQYDLERYGGQLVLDDFQVVLFKGIDLEDDFDNYYIYVGHDDKEYRVSALMRFTPLKGYIPDDSYIRRVKIWNYNHEEKAK